MRFRSSGIARSPLRSPASTWATGTPASTPARAPAAVEFVSPMTTTQSGRSAAIAPRDRAAASARCQRCGGRGGRRARRGRARRRTPARARGPSAVPCGRRPPRSPASRSATESGADFTNCGPVADDREHLHSARSLVAWCPRPTGTWSPNRPVRSVEERPCAAASSPSGPCSCGPRSGCGPSGASARPDNSCSVSSRSGCSPHCSPSTTRRPEFRRCSWSPSRRAPRSSDRFSGGSTRIASRTCRRSFLRATGSCSSAAWASPTRSTQACSSSSPRSSCTGPRRAPGVGRRRTGSGDPAGQSAERRGERLRAVRRGRLTLIQLASRLRPSPSPPAGTSAPASGGRVVTSTPAP